jgi:hypothetical protein
VTHQENKDDANNNAIKRANLLVALQLLPDGTLRGFDFLAKTWVQLGPKAALKSAVSIPLRLDATCDDKTVRFTQVTAGGVVTPVTLSHPVSQEAKGSPYLNAAYQFDGKPKALPYKGTIGHLAVSFGP